MSFYDNLRAIQKAKNSLLCVGLDPDLSKIPRHLLGNNDSVGEFCKRIIEATSEFACAFKLNLAFFEALGERGWSTVHRVLECISPGIITIGDAKRGDIGNSAEMYARSLLDDFKFTATTVSAYMGEDSVRPFINDPDRGTFLLALTSNPGAKDFQNLKVRGKPLYEHIIAKGKKWNTRNNIGLVVGATRPAQLKRIRQLAPDMPLLIPGVGAQGGDVRLAVRYGCDAQGEMALINASRSILFASSGEDFADAARLSAKMLRDEMNKHRERYFS
ncbi:MAG: Orotidine 5'-phosphate decarboxylase [Bacteroidetes bacterium]|nr:Orotidine 5'-phosphate decarboxylase [Bacteroidota bacterium]